MNNNILNTFNQIIKTGNNPQQIIQTLLMQNPQYQIIFNQIQSSGLTIKDYVLQYAKQNNIDINSILQILNNNGYKL